MPISIVSFRAKGTSELWRVFEHDCSMGEFNHKLATAMNDAIARRFREGKERFNWMDICSEAFETLAEQNIVKESNGWQIVLPDTLIYPDTVTAIRQYNSAPKAQGGE